MSAVVRADPFQEGIYAGWADWWNGGITPNPYPKGSPTADEWWAGWIIGSGDAEADYYA